MVIKNALDALREGYREPVRDPLWGHIYLTSGQAALIESAPFLRLHRILQLGPAYRVYPGATHTRAAHSIGVCHLARRLLSHLAEAGAAPWLSAGGVFSFLCAALLHDMGHFPYAHSLKELSLKTHEELTGELILREPVKSLTAQAGADPYLTAAIVDMGLPDRGDGELRFYRKLLSGALDPDKLDYLCRDARYCGVPYGVQDVDFIIHRLRPHRERGVDIDGREIPSVETVLFSKYLMYRTVYWHRSVRAATAMIKKALLAAMREGAVAPEKLYGLDDQGLFTLLAGPCAHLAQAVREGPLFQAIGEFPFDPALHGALEDAAGRWRWEEALAEKFSGALGERIPGEDVIIDIPEGITFETGLEAAPEEIFAGSAGAFAPGTVAAFSRSLRVLRVFTAAAAAPCREARLREIFLPIWHSFTFV